ncbi:uncharacterized protein PAC_16280 [Phialocephala subalpina]|uniref:Uncharacterized protein n=1 Tax=Phialocephala subalpina TaxID=576137 RepID=A0A1L7XMW5_9HELO|nr:uncharacterized protein PAC_16280 [Phialocephala subalpina]
MVELPTTLRRSKPANVLAIRCYTFYINHSNSQHYIHKLKDLLAPTSGQGMHATLSDVILQSQIIIANDPTTGIFLCNIDPISLFLFYFLFSFLIQLLNFQFYPLLIFFCPLWRPVLIWWIEDRLMIDHLPSIDPPKSVFSLLRPWPWNFIEVLLNLRRTKANRIDDGAIEGAVKRPQNPIITSQLTNRPWDEEKRSYVRLPEHLAVLRHSLDANRINPAKAMVTISDGIGGGVNPFDSTDLQRLENVLLDLSDPVVDMLRRNELHLVFQSAQNPA